MKLYCAHSLDLEVQQCNWHFVEWSRRRSGRAGLQAQEADSNQSKPDQHKGTSRSSSGLKIQEVNRSGSEAPLFSVFLELHSPSFLRLSAICFLFSPFFLCRVAFLLLLPTAQTWLPYFFFIFSLHITGSSFIHLTRTVSNGFLFYSWGIFHCVYVPQLPYQFVCQWTSRLLPCPSYCKWCCVSQT